jgi:hypothetical protein
VLLTRFLSEEGVGEITDFMPVEEVTKGKELIRRVTTIRGEVNYKMCCQPRFNYGRSDYDIKKLSENEFILTSKGDDNTRIRLKSAVALKQEGDAITAEFKLGPNEICDFLLEYIEKKRQKRRRRF